jgi:hypothetical protein
MDTQPGELYTLAILATYAGSSGAVSVLYTTYRRLTNKDNIRVVFIISLVVSFVVAVGTGALTGVLQYFLVFLNGALLFVSATGAQEVIAGSGGNRKKRNPRAVFSTWIGE